MVATTKTPELRIAETLLLASRGAADAASAVSDFQLEPTAENLAKVQAPVRGVRLMTTKTKTFTPEEADSILEQLEAGELTHVLAEQHECSPADIFWLWDERNRAR